MAKIKVVVFIAGRANYGRLYSVVKELKSYEEFDVKILGAGMYCKVKKDPHMLEDFYIDGDMFHDEAYNKANTIALIATNATAYLNFIKPDYAIVHGDRFECLGFAIAANSCGIKLVHMEAGELSYIDNETRWAISALAQYHMCPTHKSHLRMVDSGLYNSYFVGSPIVDFLENQIIDTYGEMDNHILINYNPVNAEETDRFCGLVEWMLHEYRYINVRFMWVNPNIDPGNKRIASMMNTLNGMYFNLDFMKDLELGKYLKLMKSSTCMIGNSSSGIKEAYVMGVPYLLYGGRQGLREMFDNCEIYSSFGDTEAFKKSVDNYIKSFLDGERITFEYKGELGLGDTSKYVKKILKKEVDN